MKEASKSINISMYIMMAIPFIYLAMVWQDLPETIATHFNASGEADGFGPKNTLIYMLLLLVGGTFFLFKIIPLIDPKKRFLQMEDSYQKIQFFVLALMSAISIFLIYTAVSGGDSNNSLLFALMGLFFMAMGNYLPTMKPNYFVGIRTPWTLESETNWRKTHRLGGKVFMISGLIITLSSLLLDSEKAFVVMMSVIMLMTFILIGFSYMEYRRMEVN